MTDTNVHESREPQVVIVGAGFGGLYAAMALKDARLQLTVIDRHNHHVFQPLLYQVATAALSPEEIAQPIRVILRRQRNTEVLLGDVLSVQLNERKVILEHDTVSYDYLILATGAVPGYFGHADWQPWATGLKSLADALEIRRRILLAFEKAEHEPSEVKRNGLLTFVIVGGGPTGVELAGAIAEISRHAMIHDFRKIDARETRVVLIDSGPRIIADFPEVLSIKAAASLKKMGVEIITNERVTSIRPDAVFIGDREIKTETALWAAGVEATPLGRSLGVPVDRTGRVQVAPDLSIPEHPEVFVVGDLAHCLNVDGKLVPGVAPAAIQAGRHAAQNILLACQGKPSKPFRYVDKGSLATVGRSFAVADFGGIKLSGLVAWLTWLVVHIFFLIGFRNRLAVAMDWAWAYFANRREARLVVGDMDRSLIPPDQTKSDSHRS